MYQEKTIFEEAEKQLEGKMPVDQLEGLYNWLLDNLPGRLKLYKMNRQGSNTKPSIVVHRFLNVIDEITQVTPEQRKIFELIMGKFEKLEQVDSRHRRDEDHQNFPPGEEIV